LIIKNINSAELDTPVEMTTADYGYGFGLELVNQIVRKMGWMYKNEESSGGRSALLFFAE
jgi:hypothetical protein